MKLVGKRIAAGCLRSVVALSLFGLSGCSGKGLPEPDAHLEEPADGSGGGLEGGADGVDGGDQGGEQDEVQDAGDQEGEQDGGDTGNVFWSPAPGTSWQWQLSGKIDTSVAAEMYDIDLFDAPQEVIDELHAAGRVVICYFSAGSRENWRPDAGEFPRAAIGKALDGWPGENWIDIRDQKVRELMVTRMDLAVEKHCDGVEPDNVDGYANDSGFELTASDQLDYNRFLASQAHARNLSVGLKNDLEQVNDLVADFDWALNEECFDYDECDLLLPFIQSGKAVFQVEYGNAGLADSICPRANALDFDTIIKRMDLDAWRVSCR